MKSQKKIHQMKKVKELKTKIDDIFRLLKKATSLIFVVSMRLIERDLGSFCQTCLSNIGRRL